MLRLTAPAASPLADEARRAAGEVGADEPGKGTRLRDGGGQPAREAWRPAVCAPPARAQDRIVTGPKRRRVGHVMDGIGRIAAALVRTAMIRIVLRQPAVTPSA